MTREFLISAGNGCPSLILRPTQGDVGHAGIIIPVGSRDEEENEHGLAHFLEHNLFKGTGRRNVYHILSRIDSVGGELNAYTAREETCIYASFQKNHLERAMELISDILFHSTFPAKELRKEQEVIIDEIHSYKDHPGEMIFDEFDELLFDGNPIGRNILGTVDSVRKFNRTHIQKFVKRNFHSGEMVLSVCGPYDMKELEKLRSVYFENGEKYQGKTHRVKPLKSKSFQLRKHKETHQAHCIIGGRAYHSLHKKRTAFILLNNLLGGTGMNSRLNLNIREKYGYTYHLESGYTSYTDCGVFSIYLGTDKKQLDKTIDLVNKELKKLCETRLGSIQLHRAKQQLIGNLAIAQENNASVMLGLGKSLSLFGKLDTMQTIYHKIQSVQSPDILSVANDIFKPENLNSLIYF